MNREDTLLNLQIERLQLPEGWKWFEPKQGRYVLTMAEMGVPDSRLYASAYSKTHRMAWLFSDFSDLERQVSNHSWCIDRTLKATSLH